MPWRAPVIGYVDDLGYLYCAACRPKGPGHPINGETWPSEDDKCERCGKQLEHVPCEKYEHYS